MTGYVGNLNATQEEALKKLKENTVDVHRSSYDDYYYLRWLRAREFDVSKAETMMRKNIAFRRKIGADTILEDYKVPELIDQCFPRGYIGPDKDGCPVRYLPFKFLDLKGFAFSVKQSDVLKFLAYLFEHDIQEMEEMTIKTGKVIEKHSYILDMDGYSFQRASNRDGINLLSEILKLYEAHYPERMKTAYFINAPIYFNVVLNVLKPFLSENTLKKFQVFGKDFKKYLLNDIDAEILPKFLGGERTDPDGNPLCESFINFGSLIPPEKYVLRKSLVGEEGISCIKVPRMAWRLVDIPVPEANSKVEWEFETSTQDIAVAFYFRKDGEGLEELNPPERVACHLVPESGTFLCEKPGTYVLKFDNSYSWLSTKKVFYKIKVTPAGTDEEREDY
ncbi:SEC14-like protein 2 isoform X2 [Argiope bruennichi]|uniref:SEC14-like protein 2 like protein n=2 Tax=Argiope bruennichi TaxID=94029 RepID=A0A8T0FN80_ARGBR|nr:SEC14-like protein 2 isoform X2 [Argiope bruennichi]KAF8790860.1 SEC14-like protein 2 like protein [Argiope bruennichi]